MLFPILSKKFFQLCFFHSKNKEENIKKHIPISFSDTAIWIDFGKYGIKKSSAQITKLYTKKDLLNKQIIAVVNFKPKQIANFMSECLILGIVCKNGEVVLLQPERKVENGLRVL